MRASEIYDKRLETACLTAFFQCKLRLGKQIHPMAALSFGDRLLLSLERGVGRLLSLLAWLVTPVALLLFLQWPFRDLIQAYSREANDLGQWIYALYMAGAVTAATRAHLHISADAIAQGYKPTLRRLIEKSAILLGFLPWSAFVLYAGGRSALISALEFEHFADTNNPFYFIIKLSAMLLAFLMALQAIIDLFKKRIG